MSATWRQFLTGGTAAFTKTFAAPDFLSEVALAATGFNLMTTPNDGPLACFTDRRTQGLFEHTRLVTCPEIVRRISDTGSEGPIPLGPHADSSDAANGSCRLGAGTLAPVLTGTG